MKARTLILWMIFLLAFFALLIGSVDDVYEVVKNNDKCYLYFLGGGILIIILDMLNKKNKNFLKKTHHEFTHIVVDFITFREIINLKIDKQKGSVVSKGNDSMLETSKLAPYCLPLLAYIIMIFGCFIASNMSYVYYVVLGMAYTFHLLCIKLDFRSFKDMGRHQDDINQYPLIFSYSYILCFWLFNTFIVLISVRSNMLRAYAFMFESFKETFSSIF